MNYNLTLSPTSSSSSLTLCYYLSHFFSIISPPFTLNTSYNTSPTATSFHLIVNPSSTPNIPHRILLLLSYLFPSSECQLIQYSEHTTSTLNPSFFILATSQHPFVHHWYYQVGESAREWDTELPGISPKQWSI